MKIKIGVAQLTPRLGNRAANFDLCEQYVRKATAQHVDVLVFPS